MTDNKQQRDLSNLVSVHLIPELYPNLYLQNTWSSAVNHRKENGLYPAFKKIGKHLFVNVEILAECINAAT
ncbi:MAG: hypothetical protein WCO84_06670 [bacterium]